MPAGGLPTSRAAALGVLGLAQVSDLSFQRPDVTEVLPGWGGRQNSLKRRREEEEEAFTGYAESFRVSAQALGS